MDNTELMEKFINYFSLRLDFLKNLFPESFGIYIDFLPIFFIALLFAFFLTPIIGHIAMKYKILDNPCKERFCKINKDDDPTRHTHKKPIPLLGGLAFLIPIIIVLLLFLNIAPEFKAILIGVLILTIVGILDDILNLPAIYQLGGQILAALVICLSPITFNQLNIPLDGVINLEMFATSLDFFGLNLLFTFPGDIIIMLWILICINAIKFVNGSDGLMEGNAIIICLLFFVLGIRTEAHLIIVLSLILAGSISGFLFYNFPPAKIFSGSAGKTTLGFLIAVIAILNHTKFATSIMILTLPMIDFFFVVIKRYITHKPKGLLEFIRINDRNHLHHQLIDLGLSPKKILLIEVGITLLIGLVAILTVGAMNLFLFLLVMLLIIITIFSIHVAVNFKKTLKNEKEEVEKESPESRYSY